MPACFYCEDGGYWICDPTKNPDEPVDCMEELYQVETWSYSGRFFLDGSETVTVWCRPGCRVSIAKTQPLHPPAWTDAGEMEDPPEGDYDVWCRVRAGVCEVRLKKV